MRVPLPALVAVLLVAASLVSCLSETDAPADTAPQPQPDPKPKSKVSTDVRPRGALPPTTPRADRLMGLALERGQAYAILARLLETAPHRLAGSPGADAAVEWGVAEMERLGLANVRREKCMVPRWVRGDYEKLTTADGKADFDICALGGSIGTGEPDNGAEKPATIEAEVLMVRTFEQLRKIGDAAKGKIVFFNRPMNPRLLNTFAAYGGAVNQRSTGPIETAKVGGVATIVRSMTTLINDHPHTGATRYSDEVKKVPAAAISTRGAEKLAAMLAKGAVRLKLQLSAKTEADVPSANVVGDLIGSERPDEIVLIGGHLDAWDVGHGAHDDGSGIAHCLAAIDLLQAAGIKPKRTIRVVLYMNEENGVRGAKAYVETHRDELDKHIAAIESDRGGLEPRGFTTTARGDRLTQLKAMVEPLRPRNMGAMIPGGGGVDISFLGKTGTELFGLLPSSQRYFDFHHCDLDRLSAVNARELNLGAGALALLASLLADEDRPTAESR